MGPGLAVDDVELVRSVYARWARGEWAADALDPDIEWSMPHPGGQVRGRQAALAFLRMFMGSWAEYELRVDEVRSLGPGRVLVLFTERGVGRGSGVPAEGHRAALWTIRDGLVTRFEAFGDRADGLRLAGLG